MDIKNCMEDAVKLHIDSIMHELDMCCCEKCRNDVMAIALNKLPSHYATTREGALMQKIKIAELQIDAEVIFETTKAAKIVKSNSRHNDNYGKDLKEHLKAKLAEAY